MKDRNFHIWGGIKVLGSRKSVILENSEFIKYFSSLEVLSSFPVRDKICSIHLTRHGSHVLIGLENGNIFILAAIP